MSTVYTVRQNIAIITWHFYIKLLQFGSQTSIGVPQVDVQRKLTFTSIGASGDELVMVGAWLTVDIIKTQVIGVDMHPTLKWNDVDVNVDTDTAGSCITVVKALLDCPRSLMQTTTKCRISCTSVPRRLTTVWAYTINETCIQWNLIESVSLIL